MAKDELCVYGGPKLNNESLYKLICSHISQGNENVLFHLVSKRDSEISSIRDYIMSIFGGTTINVRELNNSFHYAINSLGFSIEQLLSNDVVIVKSNDMALKKIW